MNIADLFQSAQQLVPQILSDYAIVNRSIISLEEIEKLGYSQYAYKSRICTPQKLYKYFNNKDTILKDGTVVNYSWKALTNNTVYMQSPNEYDDVYDSDVNIDYLTYYKLRLIEYCRRCDIYVDKNSNIEEIGEVLFREIINSYAVHKDYEHIFVIEAESEIEELSNTLFQKRVAVGMTGSNDIAQVVSEIIEKEYQEYVDDLKNTFRVSCFTTTPYSQLMWGGAYADCHKGFCIEYTVMPEDERYKELYYNLFPLIYSKVRHDVTENLVELKDRVISEEYIWNVYYNGALRKSIDWAFQDEWRLLLPLRCKKDEDYNVKFYPITKVYLGNRMSPDKRKEIIEYCNANNIEYVGVRRKADVFEMKECEMKCEECIKYINNK